MSGCLTPKGTGLYVSVVEPRTQKISGQVKVDDDGNPIKRYSVVLSFPHPDQMDADDKEAFNDLLAHISQTRDEKWKNPPANFRSPIRKCAEKEDNDGNLPKGYVPGGLFISAWCGEQYPPGLAGPDGKEVLGPQAKKEFYSGAQYRLHVGAFAYDKAGNRGVSLGLNHIQKVGEGEQIGGGVALRGLFKPVAGASSSSSNTPTSTEDLF